MPESYAERRIRGEIAKDTEAMFRLKLEDPGTLALEHARLMGRRMGFEESIKLMREAAKSDVDPDDIPLGAPRAAA